MKDQLISFECAKLAKEKGFDIPVYNKFNRYKKIVKRNLLNWNDPQYWDGRGGPSSYERYSAPTQSLLQKYLREKHTIIISIVFELDSYEVLIHDGHNIGSFSLEQVFKTYEEALEAGLIRGLTLIK